LGLTGQRTSLLAEIPVALVRKVSKCKGRSLGFVVRPLLD
jgi:ABC-type sulfate transport system substrate-binding protein